MWRYSANFDASAELPIGIVRGHPFNHWQLRTRSALLRSPAGVTVTASNRPIAATTPPGEPGARRPNIASRHSVAEGHRRVAAHGRVRPRWIRVHHVDADPLDLGGSATFGGARTLAPERWFGAREERSTLVCRPVNGRLAHKQAGAVSVVGHLPITNVTTRARPGPSPICPSAVLIQSELCEEGGGFGVSCPSVNQP